jgi:monovalent cation/hydrogen antiporter
VLVGVQLRGIIDGLSGYTASTLTAYAVGVIAVITGVRVIWFVAVPRLVRTLGRRPARGARDVGARGAGVLAGSGMRGAVSLAVALALPYTTHGGGAFPKRGLIVFLTFAVILFTLVVQGLSLPPLIRRLGVSDPRGDADEELRARLIATKAALAQIDALAGEEWTRQETVERLRALYQYRQRRLAARAGKIQDEGYEDRSLAYQQMVQLVLGAQRDALLRLRSDGGVSNEVMLRVMHEFDLEESRLEISGSPSRPDDPQRTPAET